jgi:hypothetical protein
MKNISLLVAKIRGVLVWRLRMLLLRVFGTITIDEHGATEILPAVSFSTLGLGMDRLERGVHKFPVVNVNDGGYSGIHEHGAFRWSSFNDAYVAGNGRVLDSRARLVLDSVASHHYSVTNPGWLRAATARRMEGTILNLNWWPGTGNLFHWNRDVLSRAYVLSCPSCPREVTLVVPETLLEYQRHSIERLTSVFPDCSWTTQAFHEWRRVDSVLVPSTFPYWQGSGFLHPEVTDFVRNINTKSVSPEAQVVRVLYVSRRMARYRRILDEDKLIEALKKVSDVSVVCLEEFSYLQQMALMQSVEILVGPYGAGLTHVLFTRRHGLLEFHNGDSRDTSIATLALACRSPYKQVRGSESDVRQDFSLGYDGIEAACESLRDLLDTR